ncbi:MAG: hypothetical protein HND51_21425 [Chloroflexi bacterium]|nr:hypothetical protein [Chloroflexota bacterium]
MRSNLHTAMLLTLMANANRDPKQRSEPFTIEDFMFVDYSLADSSDEPDHLRIMKKFKMLTEYEEDE